MDFGGAPSPPAGLPGRPHLPRPDDVARPGGPLRRGCPPLRQLPAASPPATPAGVEEEWGGKRGGGGV